jgi:hypothetical protein
LLSFSQKRVNYILQVIIGGNSKILMNNAI